MLFDSTEEVRTHWVGFVSDFDQMCSPTIPSQSSGGDWNEPRFPSGAESDSSLPTTRPCSAPSLLVPDLDPVRAAWLWMQERGKLRVQTLGGLPCLGGSSESRQDQPHAAQAAVSTSPGARSVGRSPLPFWLKSPVPAPLSVPDPGE